jgi:hypothetical protein
MVVLPAATPVTIPVVLPAVAIPVLLLDHVPPGVALVNVMLPPTQTVPEAGTIATGVTFTVNARVTKHPVAGMV